MSEKRVKKKRIFSSYPFKIKTINLQIAFVIINYYSTLYRITSSSQGKKTTKNTNGGVHFKYSKSVFENIRYWIQLLIKIKYHQSKSGLSYWKFAFKFAT